MSEEDLQQTGGPGTGAPPSPPTPPSGEQSGEDWEARFKGLQKKYNTDMAEVEQLRAKLEAKSTVATNALAEVEKLKGELAQSNVTYEGQLSERDAKIQTLESTLGEKDSKIAEFEAGAQKAEEDRSLREQLSSEPLLMRLFDKGMLNLRDDSGKPLEGEALTTRVDAFKEEFGQQLGSSLEDTLGGTVPSQGSTTAGPLKGANEDQLQTWLMENPDHPDYEAVNEQYIAKVANSA